MRVGATKASDVVAPVRLDAKYFLDEGQVAFNRVNSGKWPMASVGETFGPCNIRQPNRFERVPAASAEFGKPFLVPYDCFRYLPASADYLSRSQVSVYPQLEITRGWLLLVRSGRNLGPVSLVDSFLERFVVSDDMIRVCAMPTDDLFYFTALMHTMTGQALIRRDKNGSVVDHVSTKQVAAMRYPLVADNLRKRSAASFRRGFELREKARLSLDTLSAAYLECVGVSESDLGEKVRARRFSINRSEITNRMDSEPFAPLYREYRKRLAATSNAERLGELACVIKPKGRYSTLYVADEQYGLKLLSGRQIAQYRPIALKVMSRSAWERPEDYQLAENTVVLTADGRAEENLADCALIRSDRDGWAASGHVHRLVPNPKTHPGLLYLACSSKPVQKVLKAMATGSVIDALSDTDIAEVVVPFPRNDRGRALGDAAVQAWDNFAEAWRVENEAILELEGEFSH